MSDKMLEISNFSVEEYSEDSNCRTKPQGDGVNIGFLKSFKVYVFGESKPPRVSANDFFYHCCKTLNNIHSLSRKLQCHSGVI